MTRGMKLLIGMMGLSISLMSGCSDLKMGAADKGEMKPPERPKALDRLEVLVGNWEGTMEMKMAGSPEVMKATGTNSINWACDKWVLMEHFEANMGEAGKMSGIGMWAWDAKKQAFRIWWADNSGSISEGSASYNEADKSWTHQGSGDNPMLGKRTYGQGTSRFTDDNTMEWTWKEWDNSFKWGKPVMEMSGTNHRK